MKTILPGVRARLVPSLPVLALAGLLLAAMAPAATASAPAPTTKSQQAALTPAEAKARLVAGNARFVAGQSLTRDWTAQREQTAAAQYPFAFVLSCVDSRTASEVVFDQGFGELFNARIAGNVPGDDVLGSMEFGCKVAGAKLIVVVGHSHCGAVKGACSGAQLGHLTGLLAKMQPAVAAARQQFPQAAATDGKLVEAAAEWNVKEAMKQIRERSPVLREMIDSGAVDLVGGMHDLETGRVNFIAL